MENCIRGGNRTTGYRPEIYENWYKMTENVKSDIDNVHSEQIVYNDQTIIASVKSIPSSMFDFSLQTLR